MIPDVLPPETLASQPVLNPPIAGSPVTQSLAMHPVRHSRKAIPLFLLLTSGAWALAVILSSNLAGNEIHPGGTKTSGTSSRGASTPEGAGSEQILISPRSAELRKQLEQDPKNRQILLSLASSLQSDAKERPSPNVIMEAVQVYSTLLRENPQDGDALLGLATLCFESEILDKAVEYFERYLALHPENLQAATDYALALIQGGDAEKAVRFLLPIAEKNPDRFQMKLTIAVAEKVRGNVASAKQQAEAALEIAPNEEAKDHIQRFLSSIDTPAQTQTIAPIKPVDLGQAAHTLSPAQAIETYFSNHQIIGPKLKGIRWEKSNEVRVLVSNFPVEQMPEFAKQKFISSTKQTLAKLSGPVFIRLTDEASSKVLLEIEVGE